MSIDIPVLYQEMMEKTKEWFDEIETFEYVDNDGNRYTFREEVWEDFIGALQSKYVSARELLVRSVPFSVFQNTILRGKGQKIRQPQHTLQANAAELGYNLEGLKIALAEGGKEMPAIFVFGFKHSDLSTIVKDEKRKFTYKIEGVVNPEDIIFILFRIPTRFTPPDLITNKGANFQFIMYKMEVEKNKTAQ